MTDSLTSDSDRLMMHSDETQTIECKYGKLKGMISKCRHNNAKEVFSYKGVPFAKPPTGKCRFLPPKPCDCWPGVLDATRSKNAPMCSLENQELFDNSLYYHSNKDDKWAMDEDCLHLNVYTPTLSSDANLPVMVMFYGGGFLTGSNFCYDGTALAGLNDVVVVIPNYRTGIFGFLSLGKNSCCPGNMGLHDQIAALEWVKDNIACFGGNPNNVTIFGDSAGSISVAYHYLSPLSSNLFHKGILNSGHTSLEFLRCSEAQVEKNVKCLAKELNIFYKNEEDLFEKLQEIGSAALNDITYVLLSQRKIVLAPTIDGKLIPKHPEELVKQRKFNEKPVIVCYNSTEHMGVLGSFVPNFFKGFSYEEMVTTLKTFLGKQFLSFDVDKLCSDVLTQFNPIIKNGGNFRYSKLYAEVSQQVTMTYPLTYLAQCYSEKMKTYHCFFDFETRAFHDEEYGDKIIHKKYCKCDHGDDIILTLGLPFANYKIVGNPKFTDHEKYLSLSYMTYITNFAKHGDPNIGKEVTPTWHEYRKSNDHVLKLETGRIACEKLDVKDIMLFWKKYFMH